MFQQHLVQLVSMHGNTLYELITEIERTIQGLVARRKLD